MIAARSKQPAVLIFNPEAGRLTEASRDEVATRLEQRFRLDVRSTVDRHHATGLSRAAAQDKIPLVIAFGGDGHVNEVVNGIAGTDTTLAVIPGGTMNVFARSLGLPRKPLEAVDHILDLEFHRARRVDLGMMDDLYFTFAAGCGFDAEVVRLVESHLGRKRFFGEPFFYWSAFKVLVGNSNGRRTHLRIQGDGPPVDAVMAIASNTGPYAYLFGLPVRLLPDEDFGPGLELVALTRMAPTRMPWYAWRALAGGSISRDKDALRWRHADRVTISGDEIFARHVDGEAIEPTDHTVLHSAAASLRVLA